MLMQFGVITLFPQMLSCLKFGISGKAIEKKLIDIKCWNPRDWASNQYHQIDDRPYGGGPGMVMMYEPLAAAIEEAQAELPCGVKTIYLSPQGRGIKQQQLNDIAQNRQSLLFIAGRYEGIDQRIIDKYVDEEWSVGDFVLSGGEMAAMIFIDAITRQLPGVLGHQSSASQDSFMQDILDYPHFTRPASVAGMDVPPVLLQGNHQDIQRWRRKQALGQTWKKRQDLLENIVLGPQDQVLLDEFIREDR